MLICPSQTLLIGDNQIEDSGVTALATACAGGALPQLKNLYLYNSCLFTRCIACKEAPALKAACEARGIIFW